MSQPLWSASTLNPATPCDTSRASTSTVTSVGFGLLMVSVTSDNCAGIGRLMPVFPGAV